jgi:hypothetical protein
LPSTTDPSSIAHDNPLRSDVSVVSPKWPTDLAHVGGESSDEAHVLNPGTSGGAHRMATMCSRAMLMPRRVRSTHSPNSFQESDMQVCRRRCTISVGRRSARFAPHPVWSAAMWLPVVDGFEGGHLGAMDRLRVRSTRSPGGDRGGRWHHASWPALSGSVAATIALRRPCIESTATDRLAPRLGSFGAQVAQRTLAQQLGYATSDRWPPRTISRRRSDAARQAGSVMSRNS